MKTCSKCAVEKPLEDFHRDKTMRDGRHTRCKVCKLADKRARDARDPEAARARYRDDYARRDKQQLSATMKAWRAANPGYRHNRICASYGLTVAEFDEMLIAQSGRCDICSKPMFESCIDHCHTTERVRGLLCRNCNLGIGNLNDDLECVRAAAAYLEKHA